MNKVKYGLSNVHYAKIINTDGVITYETPVPIKGAVDLVLNAEGESDSFYADDIDYFTWSTNDGYSGSLEIALLPDEFSIDILGDKVDESGALFEDANAVPAPFALLFEFKGDKNGIRHVFYNVNATRPNIEGETKQKTINPNTDTLNIRALPGANGFVKAKAKPADTCYADWYTSVYEYVEPVEG